MERSVCNCKSLEFLRIENFRIQNSADYNCKTCDSTDYDCIKESSSHRDNSLLNRIINLCGRSGNRSRTKSGFVRENTAGNTFLHCNNHCADSATSNSLKAKCALENSFKSFCNMRNIARNGKNTKHKINNSHYRNNYRRNI